MIICKCKNCGELNAWHWEPMEGANCRECGAETERCTRKDEFTPDELNRLRLWYDDIFVGPDDGIMEPFLDFEPGSNWRDIYSWFDGQRRMVKWPVMEIAT